ncbi:AraC family transcriptional regulator [Beijerinckia sp. L45]|uniref:AraC family transcriptional regulator n=1 Tax=Beijerinckia sp. L45 TaxID=1641855 RepID=UPI00131CBA4A|nr:AraC family transcriptional regulator [Beijerinckia sp. L45]
MDDPHTIVAKTPLRDCRYFESTDLDETREQIAGVLSHHSLVAAQPSRSVASRMDLLSVAGLSFGTLGYGQAMHVDVPEIADYHLLIFCLGGAGSVRTAKTDIAIRGRRGFACNPGQSFAACFAEEAEQLFVRFDRTMLWRHSGIRDLWLEPQIDLARPTLAAWESLLRVILEDGETLAAMRADPRVATEYEQLLVSLLLAGHPNSDRARISRGAIAPASVRRAEAFIVAHARDAMTLQDIAEAADVPVRTLLDGFKTFRDMSPMKRLRDARLDLVRRSLQDRREPDGIADVARRCGFGHLGRFAQAYAERFGEKPSATLVRVRGRLG